MTELSIDISPRTCYAICGVIMTVVTCAAIRTLHHMKWSLYFARAKTLRDDLNLGLITLDEYNVQIANEAKRVGVKVK